MDKMQVNTFSGTIKPRIAGTLAKQSNDMLQ
jgi:hypothetical protein